MQDHKQFVASEKKRVKSDNFLRGGKSLFKDKQQQQRDSGDKKVEV